MKMKKIAAIAALALALVPVALAGLAGYSFTPIAFLDKPAPGGGVFGPTELGRLGVNEGGDTAIPFSLEPFTGPVFNSGLFRFSHSTQTLSTVARPGTPVPGGEHLEGVFP